LQRSRGLAGCVLVRIRDNRKSAQGMHLLT
jgi:hypothetical protein